MKSFSCILLIMVGILYSCNNNNSDKKSVSNGELESIAKVEVYYFHGKHRCQTCIAIEDIARKTIEKFFSEEVESKDVAFISLDMTENENSAVVEKFEVTSSSLIIRSTNEETEMIEDLTEYSFMNALSNPDKLEEKIKSVIELYLK